MPELNKLLFNSDSDDEHFMGFEAKYIIKWWYKYKIDVDFQLLVGWIMVILEEIDNEECISIYEEDINNLKKYFFSWKLLSLLINTV